MTKIFVAILMVFVLLSGVCLADGLDDGPPSFFNNLYFWNSPPVIPAPPVVPLETPEQPAIPPYVSPFPGGLPMPDIPPTPPHRPPNLPPSEQSDTDKVPFLQAFLIVYDGPKWVAVFNNGVQKYSVSISRKPCTCNEDETQCCGMMRACEFGSNTTALECLFCLRSTYEIHLKNPAGGWDFLGIGVRGARIESPLHPSLPGYAIDDPVLIEFGFFRLVRYE